MSQSQIENFCVLEKAKSKRKSNKTKSKKARAPINLGYKDELVDQEHADAFTSKLGGKPDWLNPFPPKFQETAKCGNCKGILAFLLQLYAPLADSPYDRTIYIFVCPKPLCSGSPDSITVVRAMNYNETYAKQLKPKKKAPTKLNAQPIQKLENLGSIWGSTSGFGLPIQEVTKCPLVESMENLTLKDSPIKKTKFTTSVDLSEDSKSVPWPTAQVLLPSYYIATEMEDFWPNDSDNEEEHTPSSSHSKNIESEFTASHESNPEEEASWAGEVYEKSVKPKGVDKAFLNFSARAAHSPGHLLRYSFDSTPLLYTLADSVADQLLGFPKANAKRTKIPITTDHLECCKGCGGKRIFEFQLMPTLLSKLPFESLVAKSSPKNVKSTQEARSLLLECTGLEFGTIMIFTCKDNCVRGASQTFDGGYFKELALVQTEDLL